MNWEKGDQVMVRKRKSILFASLGVLALVSLIATAPLMFNLVRNTWAVKHTFSDFAAALVNNQLETAYSYCGQDFREATPFQGFVSQQRALRSMFGNLKVVKLEEYDVQGRGVPARWTAVIKAGQEYESRTVGFTYVFHREDDRWVLFNYKQE